MYSYFKLCVLGDSSTVRFLFLFLFLIISWCVSSIYAVNWSASWSAKDLGRGKHRVYDFPCLIDQILIQNVLIIQLIIYNYILYACHGTFQYQSIEESFIQMSKNMKLYTRIFSISIVWLYLIKIMFSFRTYFLYVYYWPVLLPFTVFSLILIKYLKDYFIIWRCQEISVKLLRF